MSNQYSQKGLLKVALPLLIVGLIASGCPSYSHTQGYPFDYRADFVIEPNNKIHMVYVDNHNHALYHMEKANGQWQREEVVRRENLYSQLQESFFSLENGLCVYSIGIRYCKRPDGGWQSTARKLGFGEGGSGDLLTDYRHRIAYKRLDERLPKPFLDQNYEVIMVDEETGEKTPYLTPLPMTLFKPYVQSGFEYGAYGLPFYDQGVWDGVSFIDKLEGYKSGGLSQRSFFLLSHSQEGWKVEKLGELANSGGLNYLSFKGQRITAINRSHIIKRDGNGKVIMEPFPPAYAKIFSNRLSGASSPNGGGSFPNIVDLEGKVHAFVNESQGNDALFKPRMYYHVYNPDAASPEIPEIRELIDSRG